MTTVGLAGVDARFVEQTSWPTPQSAEAFVRKLARTVTAMQRAHPRVVCEGMGVSLPGRVDESGRLVFAPNLRWRDTDLASLLEAAIGLPVVLENAANACALAELWFGRHPEHIRHLLAVTVSEGIGVGLLVNGQLLHGGHAMAGEFGHVTIDEAAMPVREAWLLGALCVELGRRAALRSWAKLHGRRYSTLRRPAALCRAGRPTRRGGARTHGPLPRVRPGRARDRTGA